ncbi:hypothetical protein DEJ46_27000 [Streptomyces venezuelae]|uniref:Uncharacterized protein n=1 Tax=Streptomyces venezuelae TaxID=54571 RepID=A0A5P2B4B1_STRVZ|nr:hypothetical protein DEJ46_27000 [Streptomyces venezuelae]
MRSGSRWRPWNDSTCQCSLSRWAICAAG